MNLFEIENIDNNRTLNKIILLSGAIVYTLLIAFETTRLPFLIIITGITLLALLTYNINWAPILIFGSLFLPLEMSFGKIVIRLTDLLVLITFCLIIINYLTHPNKDLRCFPYPKFVLLFTLSALLSMINAANKLASLSDIVQIIELYLIAGILLMNSLSEKNTKQLGQFLILMIVIQVVGIGHALIQGIRFSGIFGGIFYFMALFSGLISYHLLIYYKGRTRLIGLISFSIICIELIATGTRGSWLACIAGILVANYLISKKLLKKSIIFILVVLTILSLIGPNLIVERIVSLTDFNYFSNVSRFYLILSAGNAFLQHPLLGVGVKNLHEHIPEFLPDKTRYLPDDKKFTIRKEIEDGAGAHNMYFEILAEMGLFGIFITLILIKNSLRDALCNFKTSTDRYARCKNSCILSSLIAFYVGAMFFPGIHLRIDTTLFFVLILCLIQQEKETRINKLNNPI